VRTVFVKLFTTSPLREQQEGRALLHALGEHVPSWLPHRYGWTDPPRHVYTPERFEHFWSDPYFLQWRNATRTATGTVDTRMGPYDTLSWIQLSGGQTPDLTLDRLAEFVQECGRSLDLAYGLLTVFHPDDATDFVTRSDSQTGDPYLAVDPDILKRFLPNVYWGNIFGPRYVDFFGADRLRSAPAAVVRELRPGCLSVQLTDTLADVREDRPRLIAAREAVKEHLGRDCFYTPAPAVPFRAPVFPTAAEQGLWRMVEGTHMTDELRALIAKAPADEP
jgi:hypothetical protein